MFGRWVEMSDTRTQKVSRTWSKKIIEAKDIYFENQVNKLESKKMEYVIAKDLKLKKKNKPNWLIILEKKKQLKMSQNSCYIYI